MYKGIVHLQGYSKVHTGLYHKEIIYVDRRVAPTRDLSGCHVEHDGGSRGSNAPDVLVWSSPSILY